MALDAIRRLQEKGYLPPDLDLDEFKESLEKRRFITLSDSGSKLTAKGERSLRRDAFERVFEQLRLSGHGSHSIPRGGGATSEPLPERRKFQFGDDPQRIDFRSSLLNAVSRSGSLSFNLHEDDLEVLDSDRSTSCATAVLIDISHSMILYGEDRISPAKRVALALTELVMSKFRKDKLHIILFGDFAAEIKLKDLPYIGAGPYHTNTKAALQLARQTLLRQPCANRQIFMITDGKPSMITRSDGSVYRNPYGLDPKVVNRTLDEAIACRRKRIPITTFMIAQHPELQRFVEKLTRLNKGRAYYSSPENLGEFVIQDFLSNRHGRRPQ
jgi:uncharacterized protein with von Willebrand factor type A (vWA) domain